MKIKIEFKGIPVLFFYSFNKPKKKKGDKWMGIRRKESVTNIIISQHHPTKTLFYSIISIIHWHWINRRKDKISSFIQKKYLLNIYIYIYKKDWKECRNMSQQMKYVHIVLWTSSMWNGYKGRKCFDNHGESDGNGSLAMKNCYF